MPRVQYINEGFLAGEISPALHGRVNSKAYQESVTSILNMVPCTTGPLIRRPGLEYIVKPTEQYAGKHRLIPFQITAEKSVMVHAGPNTLYLYDSNGLVVSGGIVPINRNYNFSEELAYWTNRSHMVSFPGGVFDYNSTYKGEVAWEPSRPSSVFTTKNISSPPFDPSAYRQYASLAQAITLQPSTSYRLKFDASSDSVIVPVAHPYEPGQVRVIEVSAPGNFFPANGTYVTNTLSTLSFDLDVLSGETTFVTPAWGGPTVVHLEINWPAQGWNAFGIGFTYISGQIANMLSCVVEPTTGGAGTPISFASPWAGFDVSFLSWEKQPSSGTTSRLIIAHRDVAVQELSYDSVSGGYLLQPVTFVASPWSAGEYPACVTFYQQRMILAGSNKYPERIWFSKSFDHYNFTEGSNPGDAFHGDLSQPGRVVWMRPMYSLVIGAQSGIWDISQAAGAAVEPGNVVTYRHSARFPTGYAPAYTNDEIAYVGQGNTRVFSLRREGDANRYEDSEISFLGRHITLNIEEIAWAEFPNSAIWVQISDNESASFASVTYDLKVSPLAGWARHKTDGTIKSIVSLLASGISQTFMLVSRNNGLFLERFSWTYQLDSYVLSNSADGYTFCGFNHLEGQDIWLRSSTGAVYGPLTVVSGCVDIRDAGVTEATETQVIGGLPYTSQLVTRRIEGISPSGTTQGTQQRWNKIFLRVAPGSRPKINDIRPPDRFPSTPMNEGERVYIEDIEVSNIGWDKTGAVTIEENLPKSLNIVSIFGQVATEVL